MYDINQAVHFCLTDFVPIKNSWYLLFYPPKIDFILLIIGDVFLHDSLKKHQSRLFLKLYCIPKGGKAYINIFALCQ